MRVQPGTGMGSPSHLTIVNSTSLGKSALWADHDIWVIKQHDDEPLAAHEKNYLDPNDPLIDFSCLADGEELNVGEDGDDLVVLFNLGGHHVPHSGDVPNTLMHTSASSVVLSPFNFWDEDVSKGRRQGVRVDGRGNDRRDGGGEGWEKGVRWFGGRYGRRDVEGVDGDEEVRLRVGRDLEPSLEKYFEEDAVKGGVVGNKVGGGLLGLFGSREEMKSRLEELRRQKYGER